MPKYPLLTFTLVIFMLYFQIIFFEFTHFDDTGIILDRMDQLQNSSFWSAFNVRYAFNDNTMLSYSYRPILEISFIADAILGKGSTKAFYLTNILLHCLATWLFWVWLLKFKIQPYHAFLMSLFYAVHPAFVHGIAWIPGRNDTLFAVLAFSACIAFINYIQTNKKRWLATHLLMLALGLLTKETAVLLPLCILLYWFLWPGNELRVMPVILLSWLLLLIVWLLLGRMEAGSTRMLNFKVTTLIQNTMAALLIYTGKILLPFKLSPQPIIHNSSWFNGIFVVLLMVAAGFKAGVTDLKKIIFGLSWFIILLMPPILHENLRQAQGVYQEHRLMVPLAGFLLCLTGFQIRFGRHQKLFIILLLSVFAIKTMTHTRIYQNRTSFVTALVKNSPDLARAYFMRGNLFQDQRQYKKAMADYNQALSIDHKDLKVRFVRGILFAKQKLYFNAIEDFSIIIRQNKSFAPAWIARAQNYYTTGFYQKAVFDYTRAQKLAGTSIWLARGQALTRLGNLKHAEIDLRKARNE